MAGVPVSFEFYPPKTDEQRTQLDRTAEKLKAHSPEYVSCTFGAGGYTKATLAHRLFSTNIGIPSERFRRLNHIPFKAYAKIFGNAGYVYNPQPGDNMLANRMLYSVGVGVDIITFYDFIIKLEWSFNQIGQNGLNLHRKDYF